MTTEEAVVVATEEAVEMAAAEEQHFRWECNIFQNEQQPSSDGKRDTKKKWRQ